MAITKTLIANGSKKNHKFTLNTTETETSGNSSFIDYSFILSAIQTGWDWRDWGDKISYEIKFTESIVNTETDETQTNELYKATGTIPKYDGESTIILSSESGIEIEHDSDGTKTIGISFTVTDSTGASYTCGNASASGSMILSELHTPPEITGVSISETNTTLTNLGVTNDTIVQYLSKKKFTITAQTYDDAVISSYSIYHNNILIGTSTTNEITIDFNNVSELMTTENDGTHYVGLMIILVDDKGGYSSKIFNFPVIKYTRPTIESTSTTIKRKTSGGTVLTDNKVLLNFVGTCYKGDDVIGSANTPIVQYKIWKDTEPNYTEVAATNESNVTVTDFEISNILYTSVYNYKIKIYDSFTNSEENPIEKVSIVPTGVSVWSEYKDRVDFKKITQGGITLLTTSMINAIIPEYELTTNPWTNYQLTLNDNILIGKDFSLKDNLITVIGDDVKYVSISTIIKYMISCASANRAIRIFLNDTQITSDYYNYTANETDWATDTISNMIVKVQKGDVLKFCIVRGGSGEVTTEIGGGFVTISAIK